MPFVCLRIVSGLKNFLYTLGSQVVINDSHERFIMKAKEPIFQFSAGSCLALAFLLMLENFNWQFFILPTELLTSDAIRVKNFIPTAVNSIHELRYTSTIIILTTAKFHPQSWKFFYWKLPLACWLKLAMMMMMMYIKENLITYSRHFVSVPMTLPYFVTFIIHSNDISLKVKLPWVQMKI